MGPASASAGAWIPLNASNLAPGYPPRPGHPWFIVGPCRVSWEGPETELECRPGRVRDRIVARAAGGLGVDEDQRITGPGGSRVSLLIDGSPDGTLWMRRSDWRDNVAYWALSLALVAFGFIAGFSIGQPFFLIGLAMLVLGAFRHRALVFWPAMLAVVAYNIAYWAIAPLGCTSTITSDGGGRTVCSNLLGLPYEGEGSTTRRSDRLSSQRSSSPLSSISSYWACSTGDAEGSPPRLVERPTTGFPSAP
ncbi:hypothetical protein BH23CHL8_BH23CHL8_12510 [soil metagenome]